MAVYDGESDSVVWLAASDAGVLVVVDDCGCGFCSDRQ